MEFADLINQLADHIGEKIPQRANLPKHQVSESKDIQIYQMNSGNPELIIYIGNIEPNVEVCWVEMEIAEGFIAVIESCQQLLDAGYPDAWVVKALFKKVDGMKLNSETSEIKPQNNSQNFPRYYSI